MSHALQQGSVHLFCVRLHLPDSASSWHLFSLPLNLWCSPIAEAATPWRPSGPLITALRCSIPHRLGLGGIGEPAAHSMRSQGCPCCPLCQQPHLCKREPQPPPNAQTEAPTWLDACLDLLVSSRRSPHLHKECPSERKGLARCVWRQASPCTPAVPSENKSARQLEAGWGVGRGGPGVGPRAKLGTSESTAVHFSVCPACSRLNTGTQEVSPSP